MSAKDGRVLVETVANGSAEEEINEEICGTAEKIQGVTELKIGVVPPMQ